MPSGDLGRRHHGGQRDHPRAMRLITEHAGHFHSFVVAARRNQSAMKAAFGVGPVLKIARLKARLHLYDGICQSDVVFVPQAALGDTVRVPTLGGEAEIRVPAETQTGKVFRLRDKGVKSVRSRGPGDLYCKVGNL